MENTVDTRTGTIRLRGTFENAQRRLWPGQFVEVELPLGVVGNALTVPSRAVLSGREESYVYLIDPENRAVYRKVKVLFEHRGRSVVEGELREGDQGCGGRTSASDAGFEGGNFKVVLGRLGPCSAVPEAFSPCK